MIGLIEMVAGAVEVRIRLTPAGGADRIEGVKVDAAGQARLAARVRVAPEDGKANAALEALVAKAVGAPKSAVSVTKGATARNKTVRIEGVDETIVRARLGLKEAIS